MYAIDSTETFKLYLHLKMDGLSSQTENQSEILAETLQYIIKHLDIFFCSRGSQCDRFP